jgi:enolase
MANTNLQNENNAWQMPSDLTKPLETISAKNALDLLVAKFIPVQNALKLAQQVRGQSWPEDERAFAAHLEKQIVQKLNLALKEADKVAGSDIKVAMPAIDEWRKAEKH